MRSNAKLKFKLMLTCLITLTLIFAALMISFTAGKTTKNALAADDIWMGDTATEFDSGSGIDGDPYIIKTGAQLTYLASQVNLGNEYVNKYFKLQNSINLSGDSFQWTPIGADFTFAFKGHFNGGGFTVYNLNINSTANYQGLFGYIINGSISNLNVEGDVITTGTTAGGIVGHLGVNLGINPDAESIIKNCSFIGTVSALANAGGIVGDSDGGTSIFNCSVAETTVVSATGENIAKAGGIIGNNNSTVENCFSDVVIETSVYGGGIVGYNAGIINQCYSEGSISPQGTSFYVGGIAGYNITIAAKISNCYSGINIDVSTKNNGNAGGIAGRNLTSAVIVNSYFIGLIKNNEANAGLVGANSATIDFCYYDQSSFEGENFTDFGTSKSTAEMISEEFVDLIDASIDNSIWVFKAKDVVIDTSKVTYFYPQLACFAESGNQEIETASSNSVKTAELDAEKITLMDGATVFDTIYEAAGFPVTAPDNPAKTGYTFIEWNTSSDGTGDPYTFATMPENGLTLYAKLQAITYEVKYNGNGGEGSMDNSEHTYGEAKNLTANAYSKTGYTFKGWATSSGGEVVYTDSQSVKNLSATQDDEFELFAVWEAETYQITYKDVGGSDFSGDSTGLPLAHIYDAATTLVNPTKTGYDFKGWFINSNGTSDAITSLGATDYTDEIILYAKWEAQTYTITYKDVVDAAFSGQHGTDYPTTHTYDAITTLVNPTKTGYDFMGWFINSDGTGDAITSLGATDYTAAITLYAKWKAQVYTITYKDIGEDVAFSGTHGEDYPQTHTYGASTALVNPTKTGYIFKGWFINSDGTGEKITGLLADGYTAAITLYAEWDIRDDYVVTLDYNYENGPQNETISGITYNTTINEPAEPSRTGYTFGGWYKEAGCETAWDFETDKVDADGIVLYAKWNPVIYQVKYNGNGSTSGSMDNSVHTYGASKALTANAFVKTGYAFAGWALTAAGVVVYADSAEVENLSEIQDDVFELFAIWEAVTYEVKYNGNGSTSGSMDNSGHIYDAAKNLTANVYERTGYIFKGWALSATGEVEYEDSESIINLSSVKDAEVELFAVWEAIMYQVKYNGNGADNELDNPMDNSGHTYDVGQALSENAFIKEGWTFMGWATSLNGEVVYQNRQIVVNLSSEQGYVVNLYAVWKIVVAFDSNGGTSVDSQEFETVDAKISMPDSPTRNGYTFSGWYTEKGTIGSDTGWGYEWDFDNDAINKAAGNMTLYAKWTANSQTLTYDAGTGNGAEVTESSYTDKGMKLPESVTFTKPGYEFTGWNTKEDGTGDNYAKGGDFTMPANNVTLYAQWRQFKVVFDGMDKQATINSDGKLENYIPKRFGFKFAGWYTDKGLMDAFDANSVITKDLTLYAKWTFDFNIVYIGGGALLAVILVVVILLIIKKKKSYTRLGSNLK